MKITLTYTPTGGTQPTNAVLCDSPAKNNITGYSVNGEQLFQEATFFRALARQFYARGNEKTTVSFELSFVWPDIVTARMFVNFYNTTFPRIATAAFMESNGANSKTSYLKNAAIYPATSKVQGCTTFHTHRIEGGIMSNSPN